MKVIRVKAKAAPRTYTEENLREVCRHLATHLVKVIDECYEAREEAANLNLELMERQCRIDELERRIEWLQTHSDTGVDFVS